MTLVDANILLYAKFVEFPMHDRARAWLDRELTGPGRVGLPWPSLLAFLRIGCSPRLLVNPLPLNGGMEQVRRWLSARAAWQPEPTPQHAVLLDELLATTPGYSAKAVTDAHLAALAMGHGLDLCTTDGGFVRFAGLRWTNPLA